MRLLIAVFALLLVLNPCHGFCWLLAIFNRCNSTTPTTTPAPIEYTTQLFNETSLEVKNDTASVRLLEFFQQEFFAKRTNSSDSVEDNVVETSNRGAKMLITGPSRGCNKTNEKKDRRGRCRPVFTDWKSLECAHLCQKTGSSSRTHGRCKWRETTLIYYLLYDLFAVRRVSYQHASGSARCSYRGGGGARQRQHRVWW